MRSVVAVTDESGDTFITPAAYSLIGGEFIGVPKLTEQRGHTAVEVIYVRVSVSAVIAGLGNGGQALVEEGVIIVAEPLLVGIQRCNVQVFHTGNGSGKGHGCTCSKSKYAFNLFHNLKAVRS